MLIATPAPKDTPRRIRLVALLPIVLVAGCLAVPEAASARGGRGEGQDVRVAGRCGSGATSKLRLRSRDGGIRVQFDVDHNRPRALWRIVLVQDRRVVWRGRRRTRGASDSLEVRRSLRDLPGADSVTARAWGPRGVTCAASATLPG